MESSRFSTKGQLVVPKAIREALKIKPGAAVRFEALDTRRFIVEVDEPLTHEEQVDRLAGCFAKYARGKRGSARTDDEAVMAVVGADDERTRTPRRRGRRRR